MKPGHKRALQQNISTQKSQSTDPVSTVSGWLFNEQPSYHKYCFKQKPSNSFKRLGDWSASPAWESNYFDELKGFCNSSPGLKRKGQALCKSLTTEQHNTNSKHIDRNSVFKEDFYRLSL